jgi:curved DNA-binding protein CbpA
MPPNRRVKEHDTELLPPSPTLWLIQLAKKFHPDTNKDVGAEKQFLRIKEAFEILKNPSRRAEWDRGDHLDDSEGRRPPMDSEIKWYRRPYSPASQRFGPEEYTWNTPNGSPPTEAEERARAFRRRTAASFFLCLTAYMVALQLRPETGNKLSERSRWSRKIVDKKPKRAEGLIEPRDAESARAYNEARMPKRPYVIRDSLAVAGIDEDVVLLPAPRR